MRWGVQGCGWMARTQGLGRMGCRVPQVFRAGLYGMVGRRVCERGTAWRVRSGADVQHVGKFWVCRNKKP